MCLVIVGGPTSSITGSSNGDLNPDEGVCGFHFRCGTNGDLMSSPNNLGGLSLMSLSCLSAFQGEGDSVYFCGLSAEGRGGKHTGALGNANGRVTCDRGMCFTGNCEDVPMANGFCGKAGCIGASGTGCGIDDGGGKGGCTGDGGT